MTLLQRAVIFVIGCLSSLPLKSQSNVPSDDSASFQAELEKALHAYYSWEKESALESIKGLVKKYPTVGHLLYVKTWMTLEAGDYLASMETASEGTTLQDEYFSAFYELLSLNYYHNMAVGVFSQALDRGPREEVDIIKEKVLGSPEPEEKYLQLGIMFQRQEQDSAASITLQQALRLRFDYGETHRVLAETAANRGDFLSAAMGYVLLLSADEQSSHTTHFRHKLHNALLRFKNPESPSTLSLDIPRSLVESFVEACISDTGRPEVALYRELCNAATFARGFRIATLSACNQHIADNEREEVRIWRDHFTDSLRSTFLKQHGLQELGDEILLIVPDSVSQSRDPNHNSVPLPANYQE